MSISANYMGRRMYEITICTGEKTITKQFIEPMLSSSKTAERITAIVESLNVENDIDMDEVVILSVLIEAAKRAKRRFIC